MSTHSRALRQLIDEGMYVVEEDHVAAAILARARVHATVANASFRTGGQAPAVRSFRRDPGARSFRLQRRGALNRHY